MIWHDGLEKIRFYQKLTISGVVTGVFECPMLATNLKNWHAALNKVGSSGVDEWYKLRKALLDAHGGSRLKEK